MIGVLPKNRSLQITDRELKLISDLIYRRFGVLLGEKKRNLVVNRLMKILSLQGFDSFQEYYDHVMDDDSGQALLTMIDRISTNHTFFYREKQHFEFFTEVVLPWIDKLQGAQREKRIRIWCPGCSSGEEPYVLAMLLIEYFGDKLKEWDAAILATDISLESLTKAKAAIYNDTNALNLPVELRHRYLNRLDDKRWQVRENVRRLVVIKRLNLIREDFPFKSKFHLVSCRNVMIYFDKPTSDKLLSDFARFTVDGGYLFTGHSESLGRENRHYRYIKPAVYMKHE